MLTTLFLAAALAAQSTDSPELDNCMSHADGVSSSMLACGKAEIGRWDKRLNAAYRTLLAKMPAAPKAQLQSEQRTWLAHHLAETRRLATDPDTGSGAFMLSQGFELDDLQKRTLELESRVAHL
jgi:uncharacterized protein YecT (DUF1311 family)